VTAVGLVIVQNTVGWVYSRQALAGDHLQEMVQRYVSGMRWFAVLSVILRVGMIISLLAFFSYGIAWNAGKGWMMAAIGVIATVQMFWLGSIWQRRIRNISQVLEE
jgi:hypothetical protein